MKKKILQQKAKIIANKKVGPAYFEMILAAGGISRAAYPGQFVQVKVSDSCQPLLRRPLGIHRVSGANILLLYEVLGPATKILAKRKAGEFLDILGPLGNGFDCGVGGQPPVLVAGGMGVAPLLFLAEKLKRLKPLVLIGARSKAQILCEKEFKKLGCSVKIATDDGSQGFKGKVTDLLRKVLLENSRTRELKNSIYTCGPRPMLKEISKIAKNYRIPAQVSLEEHMSCGIGACLGCVVNTKAGFQRVCKEGPVFNTDEVIL